MDLAALTYLGIVQIGFAYLLFTLAMARGVRAGRVRVFLDCYRDLLDVSDAVRAVDALLTAGVAKEAVKLAPSPRLITLWAMLAVLLTYPTAVPVVFSEPDMRVNT